jgi:5-carboxymethyl-2-hydroxymuconate isomerase
MPHLVIEYSAGLERHAQITAVMEAVRGAAVASGVMQPGDIKVRAQAYEHYLLAEAQDSFVHVTCRLLAGRGEAEKVHLANLIRQYLTALLPAVYSISVDIVDMDPGAYKKRLLDGG